MLNERCALCGAEGFVSRYDGTAHHRRIFKGDDGVIRFMGFNHPYVRPRPTQFVERTLS